MDSHSHYNLDGHLSTYNRRRKTTNVILLQPNLDPYQEKYRLTNPQLLQLAKDITTEKLNDKVDFLLTPEGYLDEGFGLNLSDYHLSTFLKRLKILPHNIPTYR